LVRTNTNATVVGGGRTRPVRSVACTVRMFGR
jgi:hypothetical protein